MSKHFLMMAAVAAVIASNDKSVLLIIQKTSGDRWAEVTYENGQYGLKPERLLPEDAMKLVDEAVEAGNVVLTGSSIDELNRKVTIYQNDTSGNIEDRIDPALMSRVRHQGQAGAAATEDNNGGAYNTTPRNSEQDKLAEKGEQPTDPYQG